MKSRFNWTNLRQRRVLLWFMVGVLALGVIAGAFWRSIVTSDDKPKQPPAISVEQAQPDMQAQPKDSTPVCRQRPKVIQVDARNQVQIDNACIQKQSGRELFAKLKVTRLVGNDPLAVYMWLSVDDGKLGLGRKKIGIMADGRERPLKCQMPSGTKVLTCYFKREYSAPSRISTVGQVTTIDQQPDGWTNPNASPRVITGGEMYFYPEDSSSNIFGWLFH
ncbi:hypothetical protein SAMN05444392_102464 [Seinonella peptonophila]|uniref:Uncharacterized protein n=2 Tax=Seinonella peptonophila TaxID=112248 RepID=A0A1M4VP27_9BACL|nr:hypothetical protein SAMN05444392_102464 [Seinonella peptonophila]